MNEQDGRAVADWTELDELSQEIATAVFGTMKGMTWYPRKARLVIREALAAERQRQEAVVRRNRTTENAESEAARAGLVEALRELMREAGDAFARFHLINEYACEEGFVGSDLSARILGKAHNSGLWLACRKADAALAAATAGTPSAPAEGATE